MSEQGQVIVFACGPSNKTCRCNCSVTPRDCEHKWDGPVVEFPYGDRGGKVGSVTCSRCGMTAFDHDTWGGGF